MTERAAACRRAPTSSCRAQRDRGACCRALRIKAQVAQQHQRGQCRGPGLTILRSPAGCQPASIGDAPREARAAVPHRPATSRMASSTALGLDPGALRGHLVGRIEQVAQHLPPNRGIAVEEPGDDVHGCDPKSPAPAPCHFVGALTSLTGCTNRARPPRCNRRTHARPLTRAPFRRARSSRRGG